MIGRRHTSPVVPADGAHTRRASADLDSKVRNKATVATCGEDYAAGAAERKAFDARARGEQGATT